MNERMKLFFYIASALFLILFCYFRLKPIYFQTVPYTFDQGRDFLQAQAIVRDHKLTLIGPPAGGLDGVFHGTWWYYYLALAYVIFRGNPVGIVFLIFSVSLISALLFSVFIKRYFNLPTAVFFLAILSISPYFIGTSIFAINSVMALPFILLLFYSLYKYSSSQNQRFLFFIFLSLGFILESELPFGGFIIPSFILTALAVKRIKSFFGSWKKLIIIFIGFLIPLAPRILFEIRHNFLQTRIILNYFYHPVIYDAHSLNDRISGRLYLFLQYYSGLFPDNNFYLATVLFLTAIIGLIFGYKKVLKNVDREYFKFILIFLVSLFMVSLFYKDNFWANYLEGLPYFFLLLLTLAFFLFTKISSRQFKLIPLLTLGAYLIIALSLFYKEIQMPELVKATGMKEQILTVDKIYGEVHRNDFCVRIYTPPVIPYTYRYLFDYYSQSKNLKRPTESYVENRCWYIMEKEQKGDRFQARIVKWRGENIPVGARMLKKEIISDNVHIELWQEKK